MQKENPNPIKLDDYNRGLNDGLEHGKSARIKLNARISELETALDAFHKDPENPDAYVLRYKAIASKAINEQVELRARIAELQQEICSLIRRDPDDDKDARIAELEARVNEISTGYIKLELEKEQLRARIAELTAALKPFADCGVWDGYKDEEVFKLGFKIADLRASRAAYLGEKE